MTNCTNETLLALRAERVTLDEVERAYILTTLYRLHGRVSMALRVLGIGRATLYRKLKRYGITVAEVREAATLFARKQTPPIRPTVERLVPTSTRPIVSIPLRPRKKCGLADYLP